MNRNKTEILIWLSARSWCACIVHEG